MPTVPPKNLGARIREDAWWTAVGAEWRQLGGSFKRHGFSFEWHDLEPATPVDWGRSFHAGSVEICLNFAGEGQVEAGGDRIEFRERTAGFYVCGQGEIAAQRRGNQRHRFITVELSADFLRRHLTPHRAWLHSSVQAMVDGDRAKSAVGGALPLTSRQQELLASLRQPPVLLQAQVLWYQSKAIELLVELLFQPEQEKELFCARARRLAHGRVERVVALLRERMSEPPALEELGRLVGCSSYYLSRTFSAEMGMTIPQYLRQLRLERAAELLRDGRHNVTEAAVEVGYSSLSHFSQAFHEHFGCCPGLYPVSTQPQKAWQGAKAT
ncbi:MAG: helix-turn-helix transcriptional regulator [Verrucomicrobiales bacterium]|nr:helix-turn-helix transcriptional regulator [Verrucomicrobiales bacterium]